MLGVKSELYRDVVVAVHPLRLKIMTLLEEKPKLHINAIAESINEDRRLVSYHLSVLEEHGFVRSSFQILKKAASKGRIGRVYELTEKFKKLRPKLAPLLSEA